MFNNKNSKNFVVAKSFKLDFGKIFEIVNDYDNVIDTEV